jgi:hypothetical protein
MDTLAPSRLLRLGLVIDALGSAPLGLLHVAGAAALAEATGLSEPLLFGVGAFTLAYAALLVWLMTQPKLFVPAVRFIVYGNAAWAPAAVAVGLLGGPGVTAYGWALVAVHAVGVLAFSAVQYRGMQQSLVSRGTSRALATA